MSKILLTAMLFSLSSCSTIGRIIDYGAAANTEAVEASVFTLCEGASVGSIRREFATADQVITWKALCNDTSTFTP